MLVELEDFQKMINLCLPLGEKIIPVKILDFLGSFQSDFQSDNNDHEPISINSDW